MSGYNTECWPDRLEIEDAPDDLAGSAFFHHRLIVVFTCGRRVPYAYAYRYKAAENRRMCRRCKANQETMRLTWNEVDEHYRAECERLLNEHDMRRPTAATTPRRPKPAPRTQP